MSVFYKFNAFENDVITRMRQAKDLILLRGTAKEDSRVDERVHFVTMEW